MSGPMGMKSKMARMVVIAISVSVCVLLLVAGIAAALYYTADDTVLIRGHWSVLGVDQDQWDWVGDTIVGHSTTGQSILASSKEYRDVTLSAVVGTTNREASLAFRLQDADNGYVVIFAPSGTGRGDAGHIALVKRENGQETTIGYYSGRIFSSLGESAKVAVIAKGPRIEVRLIDVTVMRVTDKTFATGFIGLRVCGDPGSPCDSTFSRVTFY
jgi:hypothetical protein